MKYKSIPIEEISLFKHPMIFLELLLKVFVDTMKSVKDFVVTRFLMIGIGISVWIMLSMVDSLYVNNL